MLLTMKQPVHHGHWSFHEYTPPTPPSSSTSRLSPVLPPTRPSSFPPGSGSGSVAAAINHKSLPPLPAATNPLSRPMPKPHRGLPPPGATTLPPSGPQTQQQQQHQQQQHQHQQQQQLLPPPPPPPPPLLAQPTYWLPMGPLPPPPQPWQGGEEPMRNWLHAKAEESKRMQEEEKTRQESLRLEQRRIEQDMLRASLSGGIPPYMVPMVFAAMARGGLPSASLESAQHYMALTPHPHPHPPHHQQQQQQQQQQLPPAQALTPHLQQQQQQQQQQLPPAQAQNPPEQLQRKGARVVAQPPYGAQQQPSVPPTLATLPSTPIGSASSQQSAAFLPSYQISPASRARQSTQGPGVAASPPSTFHLPRLNTGEMVIQPPPPGPVTQLPSGPPNTHPLQQTQNADERQHPSSSSSSHWLPPATDAGAPSGTNPPPTPSGKH